MEIMSWILSAANAITITNDTADSTASAANIIWIFKKGSGESETLEAPWQGKWLLPPSRWVFLKCFRLTNAIFTFKDH